MTQNFILFLNCFPRDQSLSCFLYTNEAKCRFGKTEDKLKLADIDIKTTDKTCLLGVVIDDKLKFNDHVSSAVFVVT